MLSFRRVLSIGLITATLLGNVTYANPDTQGRIDSLEEELQARDSEIEDLMIELDELNKRKSKNTESVKSITEELEQAELDKEKQEATFANRAAALYKAGFYEGDGSKGKIIFYIQMVTAKAESIMGVIDNIHDTKLLMEYDNNLVTDLKDTIEKVTSDKKEIETIGVIIEEQEKEHELKQEMLEGKKEDLLKRLADEKDTLAEQQQAEKEAQEKVEREAQEQAEREAEATLTETVDSTSLIGATQGVKQNYQYSVQSNGSGSSSSVVQESFKYLGIPYRWGGTTTSGFDCSGYMQYIFRTQGVRLPRVSRDQQKVGQTIAFADKQPGDLVFFNNPATHVGLYIGNNQYIHAPHTGDVIKISPLTRKVSTVKRVL